MLTDMTPEERQSERAAHPNKGMYYTKAGRLTWFALACGFRETRENGAIRLYYGGDGYVYVQTGDEQPEQFAKLTEARIRFDDLEIPTNE